MNGHEKSDNPTVPEKPANKAPPWAAEPVEGKGLTKGNLSQTDMSRTQRRKADMPSGLERIRLAAVQVRLTRGRSRMR